MAVTRSKVYPVYLLLCELFALNRIRKSDVSLCEEGFSNHRACSSVCRQAWPNYFFFYLSKITSNLPENYLSKSKTNSWKKLLKQKVKLLYKSNLSKSKK